jgi:hypothetical protein
MDKLVFVIQGRENKFWDSFLISHQAIWQRCYSEFLVTQQGRDHMEGLDKLRSVFFWTAAR